MADEPLPVQSGILDPLIGAGFFTPNMSLEEIKRRRAIASALASRARGYPKTIGEGLTYFGEAIADRMQEQRLNEAEKAYNAKRDADMPGAVPPVAPVAGPRPVADVPSEVVPPPVATAALPPAPVIPSVARPSPLPPAPAGPMPATPGVGNRADIYRALALRNPAMADMIAQIGGQGAPPPRPMVTANASLASPNAGAAPASPAPDGATFAEEGNPPTISRDIRPMVMAQARPGGIGGVPDPLATPQPGPVPPGGTRPTDPAASARTARPPEPEMAPAGKEERAWEAYRQKYINDEDVVKRATAAIEPYKQKRLQDYAEKRKEWEILYSNVLQEESKERERAYNRPKTDLELAEAQRKAALGQYMQSRFGSLGAEHFGKKLDESQKAVENLPASNAAIQNVKTILPNMMTGSTADANLALRKFLSTVGFPADPRIEPTEQFKAYIAPILAQMRTAVVGSGPQSEKELAALQQAVGSDIKLEAGSIAGIIDTMEKLNLRSALTHQKKLLTFAGNDENDRRMVMNWYGLPMEDLVPKGAIEILQRGRDNPAVHEEFDKEFHTPGLAARVLERRR